MDDSKELKLQCLFCFSTSFNLPDENYKPASGETVQCSNCGKMNDYDSMMTVVKRKGKEWAEAQAKTLMENALKKFNGNWR